MRKTEIVFLILGLALFVVLLNQIGWGVILAQLYGVGWTFLLVLLVSGGRYAARTLAWRYAFSAQHELPSFGEMFRARLAAQALGYLTIAGPLLSEPAKATLLRDQVPLRIGLGGSLLEATAYSLTSTIIMVTGLLVGLVWLGVDEATRLTAWLLAALLAALLLLLRWLLAHRAHILARLLDALARTPLRRWTERHRPQLENAEQQLLDFYAHNTRRFRLMFLWEMIAQVFAIAENYVILAAMGLWLSWADVLIIEAFSKGLTTLFFFVPGRVGTDEGGMVALFNLLGLGVAVGASLALVKRLRGIFWAAVGLLFLARYTVPRSS